MYATIVHCDMRTLPTADARGQKGRTLATGLGALPGFVAFVALDAVEETGMVTALCIVENRASLEAAHRHVAQWYVDTFGASGTGVAEVRAGVVIAQKGL
jgi:hypothetical protein